MENEDKLIYKELSYEIVGILFDVYNELGSGYNEKYYENAIAKALEKRSIYYQRQVQSDLKYKGENIGTFFLDFLIDRKIVLEIKVGQKFSKQNFNQVYEYLKATNTKLAILVIFTQKGVRFIRVLNINNDLKEYKTELKLTNIRKLSNL
ncbi:MAG: GxxExxY protein [Candidatus Parcubacteria bacterium]|nr:GxxExxY protein [Candidatus Parcubacteria bacterium]